MSGVWVRCPTCDLEIKVELMYAVHGLGLGIEPDLTLLTEHADTHKEKP